MGCRGNGGGGGHGHGNDNGSAGSGEEGGGHGHGDWYSTKFWGWDMSHLSDDATSWRDQLLGDFGRLDVAYERCHSELCGPLLLLSDVLRP